MDRGSRSKTLKIENHVIDILIARSSLHYHEVSLESGLIEIYLRDTGNEQPPDTRVVKYAFLKSTAKNMMRVFCQKLTYFYEYVLL